jgi:signal transduction histidine kinase/ligand-binding sensor domain-containing protein/DNA-binding response OmpR family regulator
MKPIKQVILILFCILFIPLYSYTQKIVKLGIEDGLSNENVISFAQDRDGFIWISTKDGLNRFDSNTFQVFKSTETEPNSICSNVLNYVYADPVDDVIWIASEKDGVDAYNYKTRIFKHYEHDYANSETNDLGANGVTHIDGDDQGNIWFATYDGGIDVLNRETGRFINYNMQNTPGLGSNFNWCVLYDSNERVFAGHVTEGFSVINPKTGTAKNYRHDPGDPESLPDNTVTCIFIDSKKQVWIGTRNGLALFNPETGKMKNFFHDAKNPLSLSANSIESIIEPVATELWFGTEGGGVNILKMNQNIESIAPNAIRFENIGFGVTPDCLSSPSVQTLFKDSFGNIWIGGYGSGINFVSKKEPFFNQINYLPLVDNTNSLNSKPVIGICTDAEDNVWIANGSGGICIYRDGEKIREITKIDISQKALGVLSVFKDHANDIWIGTDDGRIIRYDSDSERFFLLTSFDDLKNIPIYSFYEDAEYNLWISTDIGLYVYNTISNQSKRFTISNSELIDNNVRAVAQDENGNMWVGALGGGLAVYDKNFRRLYDFGGQFRFYSIFDLYRDSKNRMWVASQKDLYLFRNYNVKDIIQIGKSSGLDESSVRAVIEGASENEIWISTINGISHIDINTMHISNFDVVDDIVFGDYLNGSVAKTRNGKIYFGSQNGVTWFNQIPEKSTITKPVAAFTGFAVANSKNYPGQFDDVPFHDEIELKHYQNSFQINFNVLDYSIAKKVEFIYQMEGLDDGWYPVNSEPEVTFRNVKPGKYVFNLKARIQNSEWPDQVSSLIVHVKPPIWLTGWMIMIYVLISLVILILIMQFYTNKLKIENDLLLEKKSRQQEHDLNEEKLRFFTNITHELRSPMTLILGPLEDLLADESMNPEHLKKLTMIQRVANRLLQTVNQLLEFRKSENKIRKLSVIKDDLATYIYEIGEKYKDLNKNKDVDFEISVPDYKIDMFFDPDVLSIIMDNLISNAFKYTAQGNIRLELNKVQEAGIDYAEILISDTGYGISDEDLPRIFDRYYQAKNAAHPVKGTGIGLALVKNMIDLHEAEITAISRLNEGSTFRVRFLINNSYPDAIHYFPAEIHLEETEENAKSVILVVDDDPEIIEYIKDSLSDSYTIISARNGEEGFEIASEEIPDIVISDIMMPIMDGIEMCRLLKLDVRTSHIPVVLLTAKGSLQDQKVGYDVGADSYLTKPFSSNLLKSRVKNIIDARKKYSLSSSSKFKQKQELLNESIGELDKEFLKKLTAAIEANLEDEELNISYIATQMNMSHSTLYRKIKALTNLTANEFIRKVRINFAEQLLLTNKYNISEIMYRIGINSSSYFRQCFKEEFGMNPSEYLQKLKEN